MTLKLLVYGLCCHVHHPPSRNLWSPLTRLFVPLTMGRYGELPTPLSFCHLSQPRPITSSIRIIERAAFGSRKHRCRRYLIIHGFLEWSLYPQIEPNIVSVDSCTAFTGRLWLAGYLLVFSASSVLKQNCHKNHFNHLDTLFDVYQWAHDDSRFQLSLFIKFKIYSVHHFYTIASYLSQNGWVVDELLHIWLNSC